MEVYQGRHQTDSDMVGSLRLQASNPPLGSYPKNVFAGNTDVRPKLIYKQRPMQSFSSLTLQSRSDDIALPSTCELSNFTSTVGSSLITSSSLQLSHWNLTQRHVTLLNLVACLTAISTTWLFCSAIPTLLAFKRAAESLEKLMDATREELPDTMAAIRLSGMEISDLTMELSDLGQEISQGVRSSTRAVRLAEERLQSLTKMASPASLQAVTTQKAEAGSGPVVARTARGMREEIVKGRSLLQTFFTLIRFASIAFNYITKRRRKS